MMARAFLMRGNGVSELIEGPSGFADHMVPRHPDRVKARRLPSGRISYAIRGADGVERPVLSESILHFRGASDDGVWGISKIEEGANSIGRGLAMVRFGSSLFKNAARPSGVLMHPETMSEEAEKHLVRSFTEAHSGANVGRVALLQEGMKYERLTMTAEEAQFLQGEQATVEDVARYFRMPLPKIGVPRVTYSGAEQMGLWFVTDTIQPTCARFEQVLNRDLFLDAEQDEYFCEFLLESLLRGDAAARSSFYHNALTDGWMTRNEVRVRENLNTLDGLDVPFVQLNMGPGNSGGTPAPVPASEPVAEPDEEKV
jgi:HK97 family phage portal protein